MVHLFTSKGNQYPCDLWIPELTHLHTSNYLAFRSWAVGFSKINHFWWCYKPSKLFFTALNTEHFRCPSVSWLMITLSIWTFSTREKYFEMCVCVCVLRSSVLYCLICCCANYFVMILWKLPSICLLFRTFWHWNFLIVWQ